MRQRKSMSNIQAIIWDLDNTLYRFNTLFEDACNHIAGRTARALGVDIDDALATKMAEESFAKHGYSMRVFLEQHDLCNVDVHHEFHKHLDEKILDKSHELVEIFKQSKLQHVIVTHGSRHWAERALDHLDLRQFFPDERIFGLEDYGFQKKDESRFVFEMTMELLGLEASQMIMAEDTVRNLRHPHDLGMKTVLVHHGRLPKEDLPHVHHMVHSAEDIFTLAQEI